jgi:hypothetical protein
MPWPPRTIVTYIEMFLLLKLSNLHITIFAHPCTQFLSQSSLPPLMVLLLFYGAPCSIACYGWRGGGWFVYVAEWAPHKGCFTPCTLCLPHTWDNRHAPPHLACFCDGVSLTFSYSSWLQTVILKVFIYWVVGIIAVSHCAWPSLFNLMFHSNANAVYLLMYMVGSLGMEKDWHMIVRWLLVSSWSSLQAKGGEASYGGTTALPSFLSNFWECDSLCSSG